MTRTEPQMSHYQIVAKNLTLTQKLYGCSDWTSKRVDQMVSRLLRENGVKK